MHPVKTVRGAGQLAYAERGRRDNIQQRCRPLKRKSEQSAKRTAVRRYQKGTADLNCILQESEYEIAMPVRGKAAVQSTLGEKRTRKTVKAAEYFTIRTEQQRAHNEVVFTTDERAI